MSEYKECPYCAEQILAKAVKCKHCQSLLEGAPAGKPAEPLPPPPTAAKTAPAAPSALAAPPPPMAGEKTAPLTPPPFTGEITAPAAPPPPPAAQAPPPPPPEGPKAGPAPAAPPRAEQAAPPPPPFSGAGPQSAAPAAVTWATTGAGSYPKAGLGKRFLAYIIDCVIGFLPIGILTAILTPVMVGAISADPYGEPPAFLLVLTIVANIVGWGWAVFYFLFRDGFGRGQSVGKKAAKLMVVRLEDGRPCTKGGSFVRNLIASFLGIIDLIVTLVHDKGHRVGDMAAKTQVIEL